VFTIRQLLKQSRSGHNTYYLTPLVRLMQINRGFDGIDPGVNNTGLNANAVGLWREEMDTNESAGWVINTRPAL
jgi:hypothetical protein